MTITPQFDGEVQLIVRDSTCGRRHQPRFPIASMSGDQMHAAVIASDQNLQNKPPCHAGPRRGLVSTAYTHVLAADGDSRALTLWLDGRAEQGLRMAEAAAIELPAGLTATDVTLERELRTSCRST